MEPGLPAAVTCAGPMGGHCSVGTRQAFLLGVSASISFLSHAKSAAPRPAWMQAEFGSPWELPSTT